MSGVMRRKPRTTDSGIAICVAPTWSTRTRSPRRANGTSMVVVGSYLLTYLIAKRVAREIFRWR